MHPTHPVVLEQLIALRAAELRGAAAPRHPRGGRRGRLRPRPPWRLVGLRAPAS